MRLFRGTSREKLNLELGLESLSDRRFSRRLAFFHKIVKGLAPTYLKTCFPPQGGAPFLRVRPPFEMLYCRTERYSASFFPYCKTEWNKRDSSIRDFPLISSLKRAILTFLRPLKRDKGGLSNFAIFAVICHMLSKRHCNLNIY